MQQRFLKFYSKTDKFIFYSLLGSILISVFLSLALSISLNSLPKRLPLFYSQPWGDTQMIQSSQAFLLPILIILVGLVNLTFSWHLHLSQVLLKRILNFSTLIFALLILIATLRVVHLFI